jgi:hypothetical protein
MLPIGALLVGFLPKVLNFRNPPDTDDYKRKYVILKITSSYESIIETISNVDDYQKK